MRIKLQRFLGLFFLTLLCVCLLMLYWHDSESRRVNQLYQEAAKLVSLPSTAEHPPDGTDITVADHAGLDLSPLREINADVVCWIEIPGVLSYPVLQGEDNAYYLSHVWDGKENTAGAIFLDYRANADLTDFHSLLYGHRMRDGSMFGSLKQYNNAGFWREHPSVYLSDEGGTRRYDIFTAYEVGLTEIVYRQEFSSAEERRELIQFGLDHSVIETGITPASESRILPSQPVLGMTTTPAGWFRRYGAGSNDCSIITSLFYTISLLLVTMCALLPLIGLMRCQ